MWWRWTHWSAHRQATEHWRPPDFGGFGGFVLRDTFSFFWFVCLCLFWGGVIFCFVLYRSLEHLVFKCFEHLAKCPEKTLGCVQKPEAIWNVEDQNSETLRTSRKVRQTSIKDFSQGDIYHEGPDICSRLPDIFEGGQTQVASFFWGDRKPHRLGLLGRFHQDAAAECSIAQVLLCYDGEAEVRISWRWRRSCRAFTYG